MDWSKAKTLLILTFLIAERLSCVQLMDRMVDPRVVTTNADGKTVLKNEKLMRKNYNPSQKRLDI